MANSKLIAGLVGPLLADAGFAMLVNRSLVPAIIGEVAYNDALVFLTGALPPDRRAGHPGPRCVPFLQGPQT
jgi:hypothetical protein